MSDVIQRAVERVIVTMRDNLAEPLTVDDLARAARFSKFHFTRMFRRVTGVSPGRFLSALRLQQAKRLLVSTSLNVADISMRVGYSSVGTFSSRFTRSVGMSPTKFRRLGGLTTQISASNVPSGAGGVVSGVISLRPSLEPTLVFVGLFPSRVPEGPPARCTVLPGPGPYRFDGVPPGTWYVLAQAVPPTLDAAARTAMPGEQGLAVAASGPLTFIDTTVAVADLVLRPMRLVDPPVLLALLDARTAASLSVQSGGEAA